MKTNWLHRGDREPLKSMGMYHYAMYVYTAQGNRDLFHDDDFVTYAFADTHPAAAFRVQKLRVGAPFRVPRLFGFTMPSQLKDPEKNALFKSVLFRPLHPAETGTAAWAPYRACVDEKGQHVPAWQDWWAKQVALSRRYEECERLAGKWFTIEDIAPQDVVDRRPEGGVDHFDSRPSAAEFMAHWTVQVATNMDVEAEARGRPRGKFRPDSEEFLKAEEQAAENRPDEGADEEKGVGAPGGALYGLAQEVDDADDVDAAWEKTRQEPRFPVKDDEVPKVAQCDGIRGSSKALVYRNSFLEGYAQDHRPQITGANRGRAVFGGLEHLDQRIFDDAKAQQKEKFRYRKTGAEGLPEEGSGGAGLASLAPGVLVTGRPPAPAVESKEKEPPRARVIAERLFDELKERPQAEGGPLIFNQEQKAVVALVVGQVEAIVDYKRAVDRGESPKPLEQMTLLLHGQGGTGKTEVVKLLRKLFREVLGQGSEIAVASSNSAARVIGGETIHSGFGMSGQQSMTIRHLSGQKVDTPAWRDFVSRMNELEAVIVEEVSMVPPELLGAASYRMCKARAARKGSDVNLYSEKGHMFGKVPIVMLLGDFYQLTPVAKWGPKISLLKRVEPTDKNAHVRNGQRIFLDGVTHAMFLYETHRFVDRKNHNRPCRFMPGFLETMRKGAKFTADQKKTVKSWEVRPGRTGKKDPRLAHEHIKDGYEMAIGWEAVHRQMQYRAMREAREQGQMLLYVQAVDLPAHPRSYEEKDYKGMLQVPNVNNTGHLIGMCPLFIGMRVRLTVKLSAKYGIVQDAVGVVRGVRFHPDEFPDPDNDDWRRNGQHEAHGRGYYRCRKLPRCVLVKFDGFDEDLGFGEPGVVQIAAHRATWKFNAHVEDATYGRQRHEVDVTRYQFPLLPERVRTVQTAQGMGMDAATMALQKPGNMSDDDWWLHLYVMFSRVRVSHRVLVYNLPSWEMLERGPPAFVREGVRHFEEMMHGSFAVAKQRAQEYGCPRW